MDQTMTPTIEVTNPEPGHMPPLPGPGDVNLEWVPVTVPPKPKPPPWAGNIAKQKRNQKNYTKH